MSWTQSDLDAFYNRLKLAPEPPGNLVVVTNQVTSCPALEDPTIVIEFTGKVPSKKNSYSPRKDGRGMFKSTKLKGMLNVLEVQVPGQYRDLKLEHPEIHFYWSYVKANWDRDNAITTILDILVKYGTLYNDNVAHGNGLQVNHPAERGETDVARVVIKPKEQLSGEISFSGS